MVVCRVSGVSKVCEDIGLNLFFENFEFDELLLVYKYYLFIVLNIIELWDFFFFLLNEKNKYVLLFFFIYV